MIGGVAHGAGGGYGDKAAVMIAVERNEIRRLGRVRMAVAQRPGTSELVEWATQVIEPGSTIRTDGARMFSRLTELGYTHLATPSSKGVHKVENPDTVMAGPHMVSSLLKRCTAGTLHYRLSYQHMPYCCDEFTFRFNRRNSRARGMLFYRLLQQAVDTDPHPLKDLIGG